MAQLSAEMLSDQEKAAGFQDILGIRQPAGPGRPDKLGTGTGERKGEAFRNHLVKRRRSLFSANGIIGPPANTLIGDIHPQTDRQKRKS